MLRLEKVNVSLGGRPVLSDVNLGLEKSSRTAIVGRSGSGKSTLLRLLGYLLCPASGRVLFHGNQPQPKEVISVRRRLPMVHQEPLLWGDTVLDNLTRPFTYASAAGEEPPGREEMISLFETVGLDAAKLDSPSGSLSGGEKQRVAVARALALRPEALLLDEPTSALDLITAEKLFDNLAGTFPELTIILVTHSPSLVERCNRQILLDEGRLIASREGMRAEQLRTFLENGS